MRKLLFHNFSMKLLSLFLAFVLWLFVLSERTIEYGLVIPVRLDGLPRDLVVTSPPPDSVNLKVSGPRPLLNLLRPERMTVVLDLANVKVGTNSFRVTEHRFDLPRGLKITQISPSEATVSVDALERRRVRVKVSLKGDLPPGFALDEKTLAASPALVEVRAARAEMGAIGAVSTEPVDLSGVRAETTISVPIDRSDPKIRDVVPAVVEVTIRVREKPAEKGAENGSGGAPGA